MVNIIITPITFISIGNHSTIFDKSIEHKNKKEYLILKCTQCQGLNKKERI